MGQSPNSKLVARSNRSGLRETRVEMSAVLYISNKSQICGRGASFLSKVLVDYFTSSYAHRQCIGNVDRTIESGTSLCLLNSGNTSGFCKIKKEFLHFFHFENDKQSFSVARMCVNQSSIGYHALII